MLEQPVDVGYYGGLVMDDEARGAYFLSISNHLERQVPAVPRLASEDEPEPG